MGEGIFKYNYKYLHIITYPFWAARARLTFAVREVSFYLFLDYLTLLSSFLFCSRITCFLTSACMFLVPFKSSYYLFLS